MRVAVIDADLIGRKRHRFPNLACMKISAHHKALGDVVELKTDYGSLVDYDAVYISKVFTDTPVPDTVLQLDNVSYGGTGLKDAGAFANTTPNDDGKEENPDEEVLEVDEPSGNRSLRRASS